MSRRWAILTGEYPPQSGGVSDYTRLVARGLATAGDEVHIIAPACDGPETHDPGVIVHRLPGRFRPRDLKQLTSLLAAISPDLVLVQYVPTAFGMRSINLPFCLWLRFRCRRPIWTMFHEVAFPWVKRPIKLNVLAGLNRLMAWLLVGASERVFVSIPAWKRLLEPVHFPRRPIIWSPVPSNVGTSANANEVAKLRGGADELRVGHFGSFSGPVLPMLRRILPEVQRSASKCNVLLIGRGSEAFRESLVAEHPELVGRIQATGELDAQAIALHLAACDLMVQPYPDGVSCRRSSLMAGLALGVPIVTNTGHLSEPLWRESDAVALASNEREIVRLTIELLQNPERRNALAASARAFYMEHFSIERTIALLRLSRSDCGVRLSEGD